MNEKIQECAICGKKFKKKTYLTSHLKEIHQKDAEGKPLATFTEGAVHCVLCDKKFKRKTHLQRHITTVHLQESCEVFHCSHCKYSSKYKADLKKHVGRRHANFSVEKKILKNFKCSKCNTSYKYKSSLDRHEKKHHDSQTRQTLINSRKCPLCPFETSDHKRKSIYFHFENAHNVSLKWENQSFGSLSKFHDWKNKMEKLTVSSYKISKTTKNVTVFECRRSGIFKSSGKGKRQKIRGSCKINGFCPASITIKRQSSCITALFQSIHVGHEHELKHVRLTKEDRNYLASKLESKIPHKELLRTIRTSLTDSQLQRIHLVNKKDLANIERRFNLNREAIQHPYDPVGIESWVMNLDKSKDTATETKKKGINFEEIMRPSTLYDDLIVQELLNETSSEYCSPDFEGKKEILSSEIDKLGRTLNNTNITSDQMDFLIKTIKPINIIIEAMLSPSNPFQTTAIPSSPANTNVEKQRCSIAPLKNKARKETFSEEEMEKVAFEIVIDMADGTENTPNSSEPAVVHDDHDYWLPSWAGEDTRLQD